MSQADPPVFFVGAPRSGTTLSFELFASSRHLGILTQYEIHWPGVCWPAFVTRILDSGRRHDGLHSRVRATLLLPRALVPTPIEAPPFWTEVSGADFGHSWLWTARANPDTAARVRRIITRILKWQGKDPFATKMTGPGRIGFLRSIFPNSRFVHVVRSAEAQIASILKVDFWRRGNGYRRLWWRADVPPFLTAYLGAAERTLDPVVLAAAQWRAVVKGIRTEARALLAPAEYSEMRYEDLVANPKRAIQGLWTDFGIPGDTHALKRIDDYRISSDRNDELVAGLTPRERESIREWLRRPLPA